MKLFRNHRGDTIVEVLIAMAVVSSVLGGAYAVVNHTMANSRQAQEHGEALQIANKQIEYIVSMAAGTGAGALIDGTPPYLCADQNTGLLVEQYSVTAASLSRTANLSNAGYMAGCITDTPIPYYVAFKYNQPTAKAFTVYVTWPSVTGSGNDQVSVVYKAYQP